MLERVTQPLGWVGEGAGYRNGENDAGTTSMFSCLMNMPRVAGGQLPSLRDSSRMRAGGVLRRCRTDRWRAERATPEATQEAPPKRGPFGQFCSSS